MRLVTTRRRAAGERPSGGPRTTGADRSVSNRPRPPDGPSIRGYTLDKDDYLLRLRKIEGQVRGLQRTYRTDVLTQIVSVDAALQKVALGLVDQHLRHCVMEAMDTEPKVAQQRLTDAAIGRTFALACGSVRSAVLALRVRPAVSRSFALVCGSVRSAVLALRV